MMKERLIRSVALLSALLLSITVPAQSIPSLPSDETVTGGVLPNGMSFYLVPNKASLGCADFALVQKTGTANCLDTSGLNPVHIAKSALTSLPRLGNVSPQSFIIRQGATPSEDGFVTVGPNATVFRFNDIQVGRGQAVVDSVLVLLMDITDRISAAPDSSILRKWYAPADQAVIVAGDIDSKSVAQCLRMLSYRTARYPSSERERYVWHDKEVAYEVCEGEDGLAEISATWFFPRTPEGLMPTIQPVLFEMFAESVGATAVTRISQRMNDCGIPVADVSYDYMKSAETCGDESFTVSFVTDGKYGDEALELFAGIMSSLQSGSASIDEYRLSRARLINALDWENRNGCISNETYIDRCISAFLYGAPLVPDQAIRNLYLSGNIPDSVGLGFLNDFASAFLRADKNLTVTCSGFKCDVDSLFAAGWNRPDTVLYQRTEATDRPLLAFEQSKLRIKSVKPEYLSGGHIITYSNGVKVIYKKMDVAGDKLYYALALNGGYMQISDLEPGEGAFISDFPMLCSISGVEAEDFVDELNVKGMTMDFKVNMSNTVIDGCCPDDSIPLLMESLLAVLNKREVISENLDYYRASEELGLKTSEGRNSSKMAVIDNIMCPNYIYSPHKMSGRISDDFIIKSDVLFNDISSKVNDGVLVIVGDLDIENLKRVLIPYIAGFNTRRAVSKRVDVRYQPISGQATHFVTGSSNSIEVAMSARMPVTAENYMASSIAAKLLSDSIVKRFREMGVHVSSSHHCSIYPEERFHMMVSVSEASEDGFAYGIKQVSYLQLLYDVRTAVSDLKEMEVTEEQLKIYKALLKNEIASSLKDPLYWTKAIARRYLDGKDWTTDYQAKIDAVTADQVKAILASLDDGCKVEYVTRK